MAGFQLSLFGRAEPAFDGAFAAARRAALPGDAWIDHQPGWLAGGDSVYTSLSGTVDWKHERRVMYDREVDVPRLTAWFEPGTAPALLREMSSALSKRYGARLDRVSTAWYRDGRDSVAWHRDKVMRDLSSSIVAIVSLGQPRRFLVRPFGGGASRAWTVGGGDLLVMGGSIQSLYEHCVPKARDGGPRISIMFRHGDSAL